MRWHRAGPTMVTPPTPVYACARPTALIAPPLPVVASSPSPRPVPCCLALQLCMVACGVVCGMRYSVCVIHLCYAGACARHAPRAGCRWTARPSHSARSARSRPGRTPLPWTWPCRTKTTTAASRSSLPPSLGTRRRDPPPLRIPPTVSLWPPLCFFFFPSPSSPLFFWMRIFLRTNDLLNP